MNTLLLSDLTTQLMPISDTPALDASVLIAHVIKKPRTWVMAHPELALTAEQQKDLDESLARLEQGESFPYVLGQWEFFGLNFEITPDVLIPRPETELLVEKAIAWLQGSQGRRKVADIGTGSGAISVSIAFNISNAQVLATDISRKALEVARRNAVRFEVDHRIDFLQCDVLPDYGDSVPAEKQLDLICANLPYIPTETLHGLPIFGREPTLALDGGQDGLVLIRRLLNIAPEWLADDGMMLLEIEATHGDQALQLARRVFPQASLELHRDLAGRERLLQILT
jgi:release factor glutamine methyltransferase